MRWRIAAYILLLVVVIVGCGDTRPATYPVTGTVEFGDGIPVRMGIVEFIPDISGPSARGKIDSLGRFRLGTYAEADGAIPGSYQVIVVQHITGSGMPSEDHTHNSDQAELLGIVDARFSQLEMSPLLATIEPRDNTIRLRVERSRRPSPRR